MASQSKGDATSLRGARLRGQTVLGGKPCSLFRGASGRGTGCEGGQAAPGARPSSPAAPVAFFSTPLFLLDVPPETVSGAFPGRCTGACARPVAVPRCDTAAAFL